jgi:hypothetical protein
MEPLPSNLQPPELPAPPDGAETVTLTKAQLAQLYVFLGALRGYLQTQLANCTVTHVVP